ncbi:MAG: Spx/MgsR family RNA polymerase-binding regulatory protein [Pseudomonadales bacterium]|nr:Spx/MgsR family RNA polymerase-binding regulatory protein [Pseudomonadales bacterium]
MLNMYGINNCDTIRKARNWLDQHRLDYHFHDYKKNPPTEKMIRSWCREIDFNDLINRKGSTWRKLPDTAKASLDLEKAVQLMCENPSLIKRPLLDTGTAKIVGFDQTRYESLL